MRIDETWPLVKARALFLDAGVVPIFWILLFGLLSMIRKHVGGQ